MIGSLRLTLQASLALAALSLGCDDAKKREAEAEALKKKPPVQTGNIGQAMQAERATPKLPTASDRLLLAIRSGDRNEAQHWLDAGASIDPKAPVLVAAVRGKGDLDFVDWLLAQGAGLDIPDAARRTALSWAAGQGDAGEASFLLKRGASVTSTDQLGRTPLHFAVFSGDATVVALLLEAGAAIDAQDSLGSTPLMYACAKNRPEVIQLLVDRGADRTVKDKLGRTAAERAHGEGNLCSE